VTTGIPVHQGSIEGVWAYTSPGFPPHEDVVCIDESRGRIVTFVSVQADPLKRVAMRIWFRRDSGNTLIHRVALTSPWQTQEYYFEREHLVLPYRAGRHFLRRIAASEYPERLERSLASAHRLMDLAECAYDRSTCRGV
jgi:hypothetical protein